MSELLWQPTPERRRRRRSPAWRRAQGGTGADAVARLWQWSVDQPAAFWRAVWDGWRRRGEPGCRRPCSRTRPDARGALVPRGAAELRREPAAPPRRHAGASSSATSDGVGAQLSYAELLREVARVAARACAAAGVQAGDRVAGFLPNMPGDRRSRCSRPRASARSGRRARPTSASQGVLDRFGQIEPEGAVRRRRLLLRRQALRLPATRCAACSRELPSVRARRRARAVPRAERADRRPIARRAYAWPISSAAARPPLAVRAAAVRPPALHPVFVGHHRRAQVHRARRRRHAAAAPQGAPAAPDVRPRRPALLLHDLRLDDVELAASRPGTGATLVLYDGSPFHPDPATCCGDSPTRSGITHVRHRAKYIDAMREGRRRSRARRTSSPRCATILSTGSPLAPESFDYVYDDVKADVQLASISGGTDIVSCFALGNPTLPGVARRDPVPRPRHGGRRLRRGRARRSRGEQGRAGLHARRSRRCRSASGTTRTASSYRSAYFERFPGVWCHGDYARADRARRRDHPRPLRRDAQSRRRAHRHGRDLPPGRAARRGRSKRSLVGQDWRGRRARRAVRAPARRASTLDDDARASASATHIRANTTPRHVPARDRRRSPTSRARIAARSSSSRCATSCTAGR